MHTFNIINLSILLFNIFFFLVEVFVKFTQIMRKREKEREKKNKEKEETLCTLKIIHFPAYWI